MHTHNPPGRQRPTEAHAAERKWRRVRGEVDRMVVKRGRCTVREKILMTHGEKKRWEKMKLREKKKRSLVKGTLVK